MLAWGTGGIAIDKCRVQTSDDLGGGSFGGVFSRGSRKEDGSLHKAIGSGDKGRWPPNFLLSHSEQCTPLACAEDCAVRLLDEQAGERKLGGDVTGKYGGMFGNGKQIVNPVERLEHSVTVSRFFPVFYASKASRAERNQGCEALPVAANRINAPRANEGENFSPSLNHHPTVKSLALMRWLVRLITPPCGIVLDCFAGSGSTLVACIQEGFHFLGIEQSAEYCQIARARIAYAKRKTKTPRLEPIPMRKRKPARVPDVEQLALFA